MELEIDAFLHCRWLAGLRARFAAVDLNQDGWVDAQDLCRAMEGVGLEVTEAWAQAQVARYDRHGDGRLSFADYTAGMVMVAQEYEPAARALARAFAEVDTDGDGRVSVDELATFNDSHGVVMSRQDVADRIHAWDHDGDGRIDLTELVAMLVS